jgi:hypothetical protein
VEPERVGPRANGASTRGGVRGPRACETHPVTRIDELVEATDGVATLVGPATGWQAASIVTDRFTGKSDAVMPVTVRRAGNWLRLTVLTRAIMNRDRTAVLGVGGARAGAVVAAGLLSAWMAPRLPKSVVVATAGALAATAVRRGRLRKVVWVSRSLRAHAPDALVIGEFAAREPGAGITFANELLEALATRVSFAVTVQGPPGNRHRRSLMRLYERRFQFEVVARHSIGGEELVLMVRRASPVRTVTSEHAARAS